MGHHINAHGEFQSDKHPDLPPDRIRINMSNPRSQRAMWQLALDYEDKDPELSADIRTRLSALGSRPPMLQESNWREFQRAGLLWWVNRGLHLFGWALVFVVDHDWYQPNAVPAFGKQVVIEWNQGGAFMGTMVSLNDEDWRDKDGRWPLDVKRWRYDGDERITAVYPARCRFRGFDRESEERGYEQLTKHIAESMPALLEQVRDDE